MPFVIYLLSGVMLFGCMSNDVKIIDGYVEQFANSPEDSMTVFINSSEYCQNGSISILDINGNKLKELLVNTKPQEVKNEQAFKDGFGYDHKTRIDIGDLSSGIYTINGKIPFLVKPRVNLSPKVLVLYESNTQFAYNKSGGHSLYTVDSLTERLNDSVSFLRPVSLSQYSEGFYKWLSERYPKEIGYISDLEMEEYENIQGAELLIIPGHSEYWTRKARRNFDRFVNSGNDALILSGNTMWWQIRYFDNYQGIYCSKLEKKDDFHDSLMTTNWHRPILNYPIYNSIGLSFNLGGYGRNGKGSWHGLKIVDTDNSLFADVGIAKEDTIHMESQEYDGAYLEVSEDSSEVTALNKGGFYKYKLIAYDRAFRSGLKNGCWIAMQPTPKSGIVVNIGSTNWCGVYGILGQDGNRIKKINENIIRLSLLNRLHTVLD